MSGPPEEIPRSHSLLSLQSHQRRGSGIVRSQSIIRLFSDATIIVSHMSGPQPSHHSSNGQLTPAPGDGGHGGQATASIWSRARSESFRNLRDLADRDKSGSGEQRRRDTYLGDWLKFGDSAVAKFDETLVILPPTTQTDHALSLFCHSCICLGNDSTHEFDI